MEELNVDVQQKKQITYGKEESVYLNLKLTKEEFEKVKECLNLLSHQATDYKELLVALADKVLRSKCKSGAIVRKQINPETKTQSNFAAKSQYVEQTKVREVYKNRIQTRFIPAALKKEIFKRDEWKCQFKGLDNHICGSKQFIQIHHVKAFARGGANTKENLSLRCRSHNLYEAKQEGLVA